VWHAYGFVAKSDLVVDTSALWSLEIEEAVWEQRGADRLVFSGDEVRPARRSKYP